MVLRVATRATPVVVAFVLVLLVCGAAGDAAARSTAATDPTAPSVSLTSPTPGSTIKGTITVTASATAGSGDVVDYIDFHDGVNDIGSADCGGQPSCSGSIQWDTTGASGRHSLTADAYTHYGRSSRSRAVSITIVSPAPTVEITRPRAGARVAGPTTIVVSGTTDRSQNDYPTYIDVRDGVNEIGSVVCHGRRTCRGRVNWDATGLSGSHTLTATVYTHRDRSTKTGIAVTLTTPRPTVRIVSPSPGASLRRSMTVRVAGATDPRLTDRPTYIVVHDGITEIGIVHCRKQRTCAGAFQWRLPDGLRGGQTLDATIYTRRGASARSRPVRIGVSARRTVGATCTLSTTRAHLGRRVHGHCRLARVPRGTTVAILYRRSGRFHTVGAGRVVTAGAFDFSLRPSRHATFDLWVRIAATAHTSSLTRHIGRLTVR